MKRCVVRREQSATPDAWRLERLEPRKLHHGRPSPTMKRAIWGREVGIV